MAFFKNSLMNIRVRESKDINIVDVEGRIDINASEIIEAIGLLIKKRKKDILLNFNKVDMVDYSGISILAIAYKNVANHNGKMKFCNVQPHIEELFKLVRLDSIFQTYVDEETALKTFHYASPIDKKHLRRRFKRLDLNLEAEFYSKKNKGVLHRGKILNLSGDGLFLYCKKIFLVGTEVVLRINLLSKKPIEMAGTVIWIADKSLQPQSYPGMGVHFKKIKKREQDKILEYINKHITHRSVS